MHELSIGKTRRQANFSMTSLPQISACFIAGLVLAMSIFPARAEEDHLDRAFIIEHVTKALDQDRVPGAAVVIVRQGQVVLSHGFGEDGQGKVIDERTGFLIGSMSKAFTALLVMRQVEAGILTLDTPVGRLASELQFVKSHPGSGITLRHLLTHTSGLPARIPGAPRGAALSAHVEAFADVKLVAMPGERHVYSSANYLLAAHVLEKAAGKPFEQLLNEQVLRPLGIASSSHSDAAHNKTVLSSGHQYWVAWPRKIDLPPEPGRLATASVMASATDMAKFLQFQLGDGTRDGVQLLSPAGLAEMHTGTADGDGFQYGFGWRDGIISGVRAVHHGGVLPNYRGKIILLPELGAGVVVLTNASSVLPLPILATSHRLANDLAAHLTGRPLELPRVSYGTALLLFWSALCLGLLHQAVTLLRVVINRDAAARPLRAAGIDILIVTAIVFVLPRLIELSWAELALQTPDLTFWLAAMSLLGLSTAAVRIFRARSPGAKLFSP